MFIFVCPICDKRVTLKSKPRHKICRKCSALRRGRRARIKKLSQYTDRLKLLVHKFQKYFEGDEIGQNILQELVRLELIAAKLDEDVMASLIDDEFGPGSDHNG